MEECQDYWGYGATKGGYGCMVPAATATDQYSTEMLIGHPFTKSSQFKTVSRFCRISRATLERSLALEEDSPVTCQSQRR